MIKKGKGKERKEKTEMDKEIKILKKNGVKEAEGRTRKEGEGGMEENQLERMREEGKGGKDEGRGGG